MGTHGKSGIENPNRVAQPVSLKTGSGHEAPLTLNPFFGCDGDVFLDSADAISLIETFGLPLRSPAAAVGWRSPPLCCWDAPAGAPTLYFNDGWSERSERTANLSKPLVIWNCVRSAALSESES